LTSKYRDLPYLTDRAGKFIESNPTLFVRPKKK
jgi:hypothetical protein